MGHTQGKGAWGIVIRTVDTETHPLFGFERGATQAGGGDFCLQHCPGLGGPEETRPGTTGIEF